VAYLVEIVPGTSKPHSLGETTRIGRDADNEICLDDPIVSPHHAEIRRQADGRYRLVDLDSRRGTFLASQRVKDALLDDGDEILVGVARLRFQDRPLAAVDVDPRALPQFHCLGAEPQLRPVERIESVEELRRDYEKLHAAIALTRSIGVEHDLDALAGHILEAAFTLLDADRGAVVLLDAVTQQPTMQVARSRGGQPGEVAISTSIVSHVIATKAGVVATDTGLDARFSRSGSIDTQKIRSAMCVPILYRGDLLGLVHLDSQSRGDVFTPADLELFTTIATQAGLALENAMLVRRAQAAAAEDAARLERIVRHLPAGVLLLDAEGRILGANDHALALLPQLCDAQVGEHLDHLGPIEFDELREYRGRAPLSFTVGTSRAGAPAAAANGRQSAAGTTRRIFTVSASGPDGPEGSSETVVVLRDVTEEKAQEARAAQQERLALIGQLAGGVAHDFNNLLTVILNGARFAEAQTTDAEVREEVHEVRLAAARATELTRQLLAFSRREVIHPRVLDANRLIAGAEKLLRRTLAADIELRTSYGTDLPQVKVDPGKLEQVLLNLVVNARDAMPGGGTIAIETAAVSLDRRSAAAEGLEPGRYVAISVSDNGVGMPPETVARVFEPFFTTKEAGRGTGLGLATVYGIIKQAGGSVTVSSEPGRGTSFRVFLPETNEAADSDDLGPGAAAGGKETVLVAEDEPGVRNLLRRILVHAGYSVLIAEGGEDALAVADRHVGPIHLLLTDLVMPGMSGKQLAERLAAGRPEVQVLYMSGYSTDVASPFLAKPFVREELLRRVREVLDPEQAEAATPAARSQRR
jgi:signal transduction histidine kinase